MLGLHHFNNKFQGNKGWNAISDEAITHKILKNINKKLYNDTYKPRVNVLYKILDIFQNVDSFYSFTKIALDKDFKCDFLIYNQEESTYSILTAFIDKETYDFCAGASLLELNANDSKLLKYLHPLNPAHVIKNYYIDYEMNEMNNLSFIKPDEHRLVA